MGKDDLEKIVGKFKGDTTKYEKWKLNVYMYLRAKRKEDLLEDMPKPPPKPAATTPSSSSSTTTSTTTTTDAAVDISIAAHSEKWEQQNAQMCAALYFTLSDSIQPAVKDCKRVSDFFKTLDKYFLSVSKLGALVDMRKEVLDFKVDTKNITKSIIKYGELLDRAAEKGVRFQPEEKALNFIHSLDPHTQNYISLALTQAGEEGVPTYQRVREMLSGASMCCWTS